ncbi:signal transduction histidine kinase [Kineococcus radiotolerans]|uniref:histidine kinase n=1 Tax=Kineococcus radiotolerans TaxID=131568 RepID=A0A7W4XWB5_KINRA|nr:histidine kinase [Kineococcus radiotolerans]MBB2900856.1 signal transduction histidine kinase [Kineococcus radiotolerans]
MTDLSAAEHPGRPGRWTTALRVAGDLLLVLVCWGTGLAVLGFELEEARGVRAEEWLVVDALLGVVAVPLLFLRRRWPVAVAVALVAASLLSVAVGFASVVAVFSVAVRRRWPAAVAVAAGAAVTGVAQAVLWPDPTVTWWVLAIALVGVLLPVLAWGMYVRSRRELAASWREQAVRARAEQELRAEQARAVERSRIAREMHDVLAHRISLVSMHAGALEVRLEGSADPEVVASAATIRRSAHAALEDLRDILGVLRESDAPAEVPRPQPTLADVPGLVAEVVALGAPVDLDVRVADPGEVPEALGRTAFRVVQEGLTNVRKHASGHRAQVRVEGRRGRFLEVSVVDRPSGEGATPVPAGAAPASGFGLVGLAERVELVGGRLRAGRLGAGFEVSARLPWPR